MTYFGIIRALGLLCLLQACATAEPNLDAPTETEVTRTLRTTYEHLYANYYDKEIRLEDVVLPGLENLRTLEPDLKIVSNGRTGEVLLRGEKIHGFREPAWYSGDGWAAVTRDTIKALRAASPKMVDSTWIETTDLVLSGVAASLDENGVYLSRREMKAAGLDVDEDAEDGEETAQKDKQEASLGIRLRYADGITRVAQVRRNSAAAQAGLRAGDRIQAINGEPADTLSWFHSGLQFVGAPESEMTLTVQRMDSAESEDVVLRRETVNFDEAIALWRGRNLYLQITGLWAETVEPIKELLKGEKAKGAEGVSGIILDLRGTLAANPFAASLFLDLFNEGEDRYFTTQGQNVYYYSFRPRKAPVDTEIPIVVLVDGETGGAAEGIAAAFQDRGRAIVVGSATLGQGRIQAGVVLLNGGILYYTRALMLSSSGYTFDNRGMLPMICRSALGSGKQALAGLKSGQGHIERATRQREIDDTNAAALDAHRSLCPPRISQDDDDLELAEAILADPAMYAEILKADRR